MIDQEMLDELYVSSVSSEYMDALDLPEEVYTELIALAMLGLWAKNHAVPALEAYESTDTVKEWCSIGGSGCSTKWFHGVVSGSVAKEALALKPQLPLVSLK
jgi:hypothetical protein